MWFGRVGSFEWSSEEPKDTVLIRQSSLGLESNLPVGTWATLASIAIHFKQLNACSYLKLWKLKADLSSGKKGNNRP